VTIIRERVQFEGALGEWISGRLDRPEGRPVAYALFAHCFTCGKDVRAARRIGQGLAERGIAVLRFDFTGLGESEGDFADTSFSSNLDDLVAAAGWLRDTHRPPRLLLGHSLGGAAVVAAARRIPEARAVVTIAAPHDVAAVRHRFDDVLEELACCGEARVNIAGRSFRIREQMVDDLGRHRLDEHLRRLGRALMVLHSPADVVVPVDNARSLFSAARHPKSFVSLDQMDHLLSRPADGEYVAGLVAAWASRYLGDE